MPSLGRVLDGVAEPARRPPRRLVLAVAHAGVIRAVERHLGIDDGLVPNLGGRILDVHEAWLTPASVWCSSLPISSTAPQQL